MKKIIALLIMAVLLISLCACSSDIPANTVFSAEDLQGKSAGITSNTPAYCNLSKFTDMGAYARPYSAGETAIADLKAGTLDCVIMDKYMAKDLVSFFGKVKTLSEPVLNEGYSIVTAPESVSLMKILDKALGEVIDDDTVENIIAHYIDGDEYTYTSPEDIEYTGTLTLGVNAIGMPFAYYDNNELVGIDIDIARAVCDKMGLELVVRDAGGTNLYDFVRAGKADLAMGLLTENKETRELVNFSQVYFTDTQVIIVRKK